MMDIEYMPTATKDVFTKLSEASFINKYTLVGGTALSIQIKHRLSEDLDFIADGETINLTSIKRNIARLWPNYRIVKQDYNYQIDFIINNVKLTFFSTGAIQIPFHIKSYSIAYKNINIAKTEIIASLKLAAIAQRNTIRDYYDLYFITKYKIGLSEIIEQTKKLIPNLSPVTYTETLVYTDDIPENDLSEHLEPKENISKTEIADFFVRELKKIYK